MYFSFASNDAVFVHTGRGRVAGGPDTAGGAVARNSLQTDDRGGLEAQLRHGLVFTEYLDLDRLLRCLRCCGDFRNRRRRFGRCCRIRRGRRVRVILRFVVLVFEKVGDAAARQRKAKSRCCQSKRNHAI